MFIQKYIFSFLILLYIEVPFLKIINYIFSQKKKESTYIRIYCSMFWTKLLTYIVQCFGQNYLQGVSLTVSKPHCRTHLLSVIFVRIYAQHIYM